MVLQLEREFSDLTSLDLTQALFIRSNPSPLLLTVRHDGISTKLGCAELPVVSQKPRDLFVRCIAKDVYLEIFNQVGVPPSLVVQRIRRQHASSEVNNYFLNTSLVEAESLLRRADGRKLCVDLHGFTLQPEFGEYDLILGTGHRKTLGNSDIDYQFAKFFKDTGYKVYLPGTNSREGERWAATNPETLVQILRSLEDPNLAAIQIEISRKFRQDDTKGLGKKLASDMANFFSTWVKSS